MEESSAVLSPSEVSIDPLDLDAVSGCAAMCIGVCILTCV